MVPQGPGCGFVGERSRGRQGGRGRASACGGRGPRLWVSRLPVTWPLAARQEPGAIPSGSAAIHPLLSSSAALSMSLLLEARHRLPESSGKLVLTCELIPWLADGSGHSFSRDDGRTVEEAADESSCCRGADAETPACPGRQAENGALCLPLRAELSDVKLRDAHCPEPGEVGETA